VVENDEADISALIDEALSFAEKVLWAVDQPSRVFYARLPRRHAAHLLAQAAKQLAE
jgi:hypothetical protein